LHDFENLEALAASNSIFAIHDVGPDDMDARRATSKAETAFYTDRRTSSGGSRIRAFQGSGEVHPDGPMLRGAHHAETTAVHPMEI